MESIFLSPDEFERLRKSNSCPRESNNFDKLKYVFNVTSRGVFLGSRYIGQGVLNGTTLFVHQYTPINARNFLATPINPN